MTKYNHDRKLISVVVFAAVFALIAATSTQATVIAKWSFEAADFLGDSSGNGNTLANHGATSEIDGTSGAPGTGIATFNGTSSWMSTLGSLDLSPYDNLRISWYQKINTTTYGNVWEHSASFIGNPGAIVADTNDGTIGGKVGIWGANPTISASNYNLDDYPHATNGTWEQFTVEFDLNASSGADVTKVYSNGTLISSGTAASTTNLAPFINDTFFIGTRGNTAGYLNGSIDELVIETVPEPELYTIAKWSFEANAFLADSSGNGHTLANHGATPVEDPHAGAPGTGVACFDGMDDWMATVDAIDLSLYSDLSISWWQKISSEATAIVWEHSPSFISNPGGIVADVNDGGIGNGKAGVWGTGGSPPLNLDEYPHSTDGTWEQITVELDLEAASGADVTKVYRNGTLVSTASSAQTTNLGQFLNDNFFIGARGGASAYLNGYIDEMVIQSTVPEPGTFALLLTAGLSFALLRRRNG